MFYTIKCSEQEARFKKCYNVVISEKNLNVSVESSFTLQI